LTETAPVISATPLASCITKPASAGIVVANTELKVCHIVFIVQLKLLNIGCHVTSLFIGCMLYADDIILISPSVDGLQQMLDKCSELASYLSLSFNVNKSHCIAVGKMHNYVIKPMTFLVIMLNHIVLL